MSTTVAGGWPPSPANDPGIRKVLPASYVIYLDNYDQKYHAGADGSLGLPGTDTVNTDVGALITSVQTALPATGGLIHFRTGKFPVASQVVISKPIVFKGEGSGFLWNSVETAPTELQWTGTANSTPMFKIADQTEGVVFDNLKLFYNSTSTSTDAIFTDGTTFNRHHVLNNVNIQSFTGYGLHTQKSTFDVSMFGGGFMNNALGNVFIEASTGTPTQHHFFGVDNIINTASVYAVVCQGAQCSWYGGNIANGVNGGNGIDIQGVNGTLLAGVDIEGATVASTIGVRYTGSSLKIIGGRIITWATGLQIGQGTATQAINWDVDTTFSGNTTEDVKVTAGGARIGRIREVSENTLTTVTNLRASSDGVYTDLKRYKMVPQGVAAVTPGASAWTYQNQDFVPETIYLDGARGAAGTLTVAKNSITVYSIGNSEKFHLSVYLEAGESMIVTYTSGAGDTLTANKDRK